MLKQDSSRLAFFFSVATSALMDSMRLTSPPSIQVYDYHAAESVTGLRPCRSHEPLSHWRYLTQDMTLLLLRDISTDGVGETILRREIVSQGLP